MRNDTGLWTAHVVMTCIFAVTKVAFGAEGPDAAAPLERNRTSSLSWVRLKGAESCIATQKLAQSVEARLGRRVFVSAADADLSVEGRVERGPSGWSAIFELRDRAGKLVGTRELKSAEAAATGCSALDEPLTFVLSVLIEPHVTPAADASAETAPQTPATAREPERVIVRVPVASPQEPAISFTGHVSIAVGGGFLPKPGLGVALGAIVEPRSFWGILVGGQYWFESEVTAEQGARANASSALGTAGLCPISHSEARDRLAAHLCAGAQVGSLRSRGAGFSVSSGDEVFVAYGTVLGQASYRAVGPLSIVGGGALSLPFARGELRYRTADGADRTLFLASPVAVAAHLGLGVRFP